MAIIAVNFQTSKPISTDEKQNTIPMTQYGVQSTVDARGEQISASNIDFVSLQVKHAHLKQKLQFPDGCAS